MVSKRRTFVILKPTPRLMMMGLSGILVVQIIFWIVLMVLTVTAALSPEYHPV